MVRRSTGRPGDAVCVGDQPRRRTCVESPRAFPRQAPRNSMCAGTPLSVLSVLSPGSESRCRAGGVSRTTKPGCQAGARVTVRAARKTLQNHPSRAWHVEARAPNLAMGDAFRAETSSTTTASVSRDDAAVSVGDGTVTLFRTMLGFVGGASLVDIFVN